MNPNQKQSTVFYGWWVVSASFFISLYTGGVIFLGFTAVFEPIVREFGWSYAQVSFAPSVLGLEVGLLAPLIGFLVDLFGPRRLLLAATAITGLGLMLLSRVNSLGGFYGAFILVAMGMSAFSSTLFLTAVANWFRRKVSIATGITASGFALGGLMVPLVAALIDTFGWRTAIAGLALGTWSICFPLSLLIRHRPEQYGWLPDGDIATDRIPTATNHPPTSMDIPDVDMMPKQALRSRSFWHISLAFMCQMVVINAVVVHVMPYLSSIDLPRTASSLVASAVPIASICGRMSFGWLGDRMNRKRLTVTAFFLTSAGMASFGGVANGKLWLLVPFLVFFGMGWGGAVIMRVALLREYFGRKWFGTTYGFAMGIVMLGNLMGPPVTGWAFDRWSTYQGIWFAFAGLAVVSLLLVATTPSLDRATRFAPEAKGSDHTK
ncbi:MAG: MFS transporter [Desulfobacterales bacterium]|nr:MFS transporter [Desulfobacterales bacterium]